MKKSSLLVLFVICTILFTNAQPPKAFNYQTIVRDNNGNILAKQSVGFRISILKGSASYGAPVVYAETQLPTTNDFGLANLEIGSGTVLTGKIDSISWSSDKYFIKIDIDIAGGTNYVTMGTSQLLSVPYALYAEKSGATGATSNKSPLNYVAILEFGSSTSWTCPADIRFIIVELWSAGGGGAVGAFGGYGGYIMDTLNVTPGKIYSITVGTGGTAGNDTINGGTGGTSSFGNLLSVSGGTGGIANGNSGTNGSITNFNYTNPAKNKTYIPSIWNPIPGMAQGGTNGNNGFPPSAGVDGFVRIRY